MAGPWGWIKGPPEDRLRPAIHTLLITARKDVDGWARKLACSSRWYLRELQASLEDGSYRPHPVKRVEIPKGDGKTRPLGIPVVKSCPRAGEAGPEGPYRAGGSEDGHRANPPGPPAGRPEDML